MYTAAKVGDIRKSGRGDQCVITQKTHTAKPMNLMGQDELIFRLEDKENHSKDV